MKKISSVVFASFLFMVGISAQDETLFGESGLRLTGAWGGPTYGSTFFFEGNGAGTRGGFGGLEFNRVLFVGVGSERTNEVNNPESGPDFKFERQGLIIDFTPLSRKVIHPRVNFWIGSGELEVNERTDDIFVVQPGVGFELNVFQWCKVGAEGGYRFVTRVDTIGLENEDLSTPFFNVRLRFGWSWRN